MKIPENIKNVSKLEKRPLITRGLKLMEESGELAAEILRYKGEKTSNGKTQQEILQDLHLEAVDVMLMAMDILITTGASDEEITKIIDNQLNRWKNS